MTRCKSFGLRVVFEVVVSVVAVVYIGRFYVLSCGIDLAYTQVWIFDQMVEKAKEGGFSEAAGALRYTTRYYPAGIWFKEGSTLSVLVEKYRHASIDEIIGELRRKGGRDYGNDPKAWIEAYASSS